MVKDRPYASKSKGKKKSSSGKVTKKPGKYRSENEKKYKKLAKELAKFSEADIDYDAEEQEMQLGAPQEQPNVALETEEEVTEEFIALKSSDEDAKKKKKDKKRKKSEDTTRTDEEHPNNDSEEKMEHLSMFDTKPEAGLESDPHSGSDPDDNTALLPAEAEIQVKPKTKREERRFLNLKKREMFKIQARLGIQPGSKEPHAEVDKQVDAWVRRREVQQARMEEKRRERRIKKAAKREHKKAEKREKAAKKAEEKKKADAAFAEALSF